MRPMPFVIQQTTERIFHGSGNRSEYVGLDRGQVDNILTDEHLGNPDALGVDLVQDQHLGFGRVGDPVDRLEMDFLEPILFLYPEVFVIELSLPGVHDHGPVVCGD